MTDLRKAAEMALEVLTLINQDIEKHRATLPVGRQSELCKASLALRQALAQPEQGNSSLNYHIAESNTPLDKIVEIAIQGHASTRDAIRWAMQQEREAIITWLVEDGFFIKDGPLSEQVREKLHHSIYFDVNRRKTPEVTPEVTGDVGACVTCGAPKGEWLVDAVNMSQERVDETTKREHEPYPEGDVVGPCICGSWPGGKCLKCKRIEPPKREWVGLTEEEVHILWMDMGARPKINGYDFAKVIESKLKERNCG